MELKLPAQVMEFIQKFSAAGFECFAVGGSVRDLLLGRQTEESKRFDFATSAKPEEIQKLFPDSFYDNSFGTVGVKFADEIFEVTTYRKEGQYSDARHPDKVHWAKTIEEDLKRREATISAIATDGKAIIDPFDGQKDLKAKIFRAVGNPNDRYKEDALRMIRAIRISTQLGLVIEDETFQAIQKNAAAITKISTERIRDELIKILSSDFPYDGIKLLHNANLLSYILPELTAGIGMKQPGHHISDVFVHSLDSLKFCKNRNWVVRFATLLHDIGKPPTLKELNGKPTFYNHEVVGARIARDICRHLHFKKEDIQKIFILVRWHMFSVSELITDAAVRRFIHRVGVENTEDMLDLRIGDRLGSGSKASSWRLEDFKKRVVQVQQHTPSVTDLEVNGHDVMEVLRIPPGPQICKILNKLFEEITDDPSKNKRDYLLKRIKELP
ncbi:MAG: CCA tRNA nucleotidyltransferase [Patescibacteria group bacterium]